MPLFVQSYRVVNFSTVTSLPKPLPWVEIYSTWHFCFGDNTMTKLAVMVVLLGLLACATSSYGATVDVGEEGLKSLYYCTVVRKYRRTD